VYEKYKTIKFERRGRVLTVKMDNPPLNSAAEALHKELSEVFYDIALDDEAAVVVLTGEGRAFSAGGDLNDMKAHLHDGDWQAYMFRQGPFIVHGLLNLNKVVIARINGHAMGFGATIALLCDLTIASDAAKIGDPHVLVGISAGDGGAFIWPQHIGFARAKWHLLTGEPIMAPDAAAMGLINKAVPRDALDKVVDELADRLANGPTLALNATKRSMNMLLKKQVEGVIEAHLGLEMLTVFSHDHREAVRAFLSKEAPRFEGR
jgi:enoyl-CoA hydratase